MRALATAKHCASGWQARCIISNVDTIPLFEQAGRLGGSAHGHSHATFGHHTAEDPNFSHAGYVQGLIWYSYFTSDPVAVRGAQGIADWVLKPGESVELWYNVRAPAQINLTSDHNRIAYGHWSAVYERQGKSHLAHRWVQIALER